MFSLAPLLAVHIADGILGAPWLIGGFVLATVFVALGSIRIREEEIPRTVTGRPRKAPLAAIARSRLALSNPDTGGPTR